MLLHQAVRGFELWFGIKPEVTRISTISWLRDIEPGYPAYDCHRAHRLDRHGQDRDRATCSPISAFRSSIPMPRFTRFMQRGGAAVAPIAQGFSAGGR